MNVIAAALGHLQAGAGDLEGVAEVVGATTFQAGVGVEEGEEGEVAEEEEAVLEEILIILSQQGV